MNHQNIFGGMDSNQIDSNDPDNYGDDEGLPQDFPPDGIGHGMYGHSIGDYPNFGETFNTNPHILRSQSGGIDYESPSFEYQFNQDQHQYYFNPSAHGSHIYHQNPPYHDAYQNYQLPPSHAQTVIPGGHSIGNYDQRFIEAESDFRQDYNSGNYRGNVQPGIRQQFLRGDSRHINYYPENQNQYQTTQYGLQNHPNSHLPHPVFNSPPLATQNRSPTANLNYSSHMSTPRQDRTVETLKRTLVSQPFDEINSQNYENERGNNSFVSAIKETNTISRPTPNACEDIFCSINDIDRRKPLDTKLLEVIALMRQAVVNLGVCPVQEIDVDVLRSMPTNEELYKKIHESGQKQEIDLFPLVNVLKDLEAHERVINKPKNPDKTNEKNILSSVVSNQNSKAHETDYPVPSSYLIYKTIKDKMAKFDGTVLHEDVLLYVYYSMENDCMKMSAIANLFHRGWRFNLQNKTWYRLPMEYSPGDTYKYFDPSKWELITCDKVLNMSHFETESYSKYLNHKASIVISQNEIKSQSSKEK